MSQVDDDCSRDSPEPLDMTLFNGKTIEDIVKVDVQLRHPDLMYTDPDANVWLEMYRPEWWPLHIPYRNPCTNGTGQMLSALQIQTLLNLYLDTINSRDVEDITSDSTAYPANSTTTSGNSSAALGKTSSSSSSSASRRSRITSCLKELTPHECAMRVLSGAIFKNDDLRYIVRQIVSNEVAKRDISAAGAPTLTSTGAGAGSKLTKENMWSAEFRPVWWPTEVDYRAPTGSAGNKTLTQSQLKRILQGYAEYNLQNPVVDVSERNGIHPMNGNCVKREIENDDLDSGTSTELPVKVCRVESVASSVASEGQEPLSIGFVGADRICQAMAAGFLSAGLVNSSRVMASPPAKEFDPFTDKLDQHEQHDQDSEAFTAEDEMKWKLLGARTTRDTGLVAESSQVLVVCTRALLTRVAPHVSQRHLVLSLDPHCSLADMHKLFSSGKSKRHVAASGAPRLGRVLPSPAVDVLASTTCYCLGEHATDEDKDLVIKLLNSVGISQHVPESSLDTAVGFTSVAPAFIMTMLEGLTDGAVKVGLPRGVALQFASQAMLGAAKTVQSTELHPAALRDAALSKCAQTGAAMSGILELERSGVRATLMSAVEAAVPGGSKTSGHHGRMVNGSILWGVQEWMVNMFT